MKTPIKAFVLINLVLASAGITSQAQTVKRPNILFAIADDWSYGHAGAYGCRWVQTPAFDRIARQGILFTNAYTPNAKCAPSRSCILTGRNPWQLKAAANHVPFFPPEFKTYAEALAEHGYFVGKTAKAWAPGVAVDAAGRPRQMCGRPFDSRACQPPTTGISRSDYAANFEDFLNAAPRDQPWCFWYGGHEPHRSYEYGSGVAKGGKRLSDIVRVPGCWPDNEVVRNDLLDYSLEVEYFDRHLGRMLELLEKRGMLDNTVVVVTSDNGMPFPHDKGQAYPDANHLPLAVMWKQGLRVPSRVVDDFVSFVDFAPTFIELAGLRWDQTGMAPAAGRSLTDLFLSDKAGRVNPKRDHVLVGKERTDIGRPHDWGYPIRGIVKDDLLYLHNFEPSRWPGGNPETGYLDCDGGPTKTEVLKSRLIPQQKRFWDLCFGKRPREELYNLKTDPDALDNLVGDSKFQDRKARLRQLLFDELKAQEDPRMFGKGHEFEQFPYAEEKMRGFYERYMKGEKIRAGWVNESDFEPPPQTAGRPNIIIIISDDMGFSDLGCYGGEIGTPNLDSLAANGLRFTQFYNSARCCPTRASLLTGLYPHQAGVGHMMEDRGHDGYRGDLNRRSVTIAEVLRPAGYATYAVGKWHVTPGNTAERLTRTHNWPLQRGFDRYYGTIHGAGSYYDPSALVRDNRLITAFNDPEYRPAQYYYTDAISEHAVRFIAEHGRGNAEGGSGAKPFFMYVAYTAAHWPMHALEKDVAKYRGRYDQGYAPVRQARHDKARRLGVIDSAWLLSPQAGDWDKVENKAWEARCMEVYAAMVDNMDQGIGRIVAELKKQGLFDNTAIFFLQDNGGCAETTGRAPSAQNPQLARPDAPLYPPMSKDDMQYGSTPKQTRQGFPVIMGTGVMPGPADTFIAYGKGWANASNTPFREYKHWTHEGGISSPLIIHWPAGIPPARRKGIVRSPGHLIDLMATCVDLGGARYPKEFGGEKIQALEGVSLRPVLTGGSLKRPQPLFWEHEGNRAVRDGKWKLVAKENNAWELYDMEADRTEMNNLAAKRPEKVKALAAKWEQWAARANVLPLGTWRAKAK